MHDAITNSLRGSQYLLILTGAGVSAESGPILFSGPRNLESTYDLLHPASGF